MSPLPRDILAPVHVHDWRRHACDCDRCRVYVCAGCDATARVALPGTAMEPTP